MGTPEYVVPPLDALLAADYAKVVGVYTQPDRPSGRGGAITSPAVARHCSGRGLPLFQPTSLRNAAAQRQLAELEPDVVVVAAYGRLLPEEVLSIPRYGCLNIHPSLLPRHRGPSPVVTALLEGDRTTGVTIMVVDAGMDSGPVVVQATAEVGEEETATDLTFRLFRVGGELMASILPQWVAGELTPVEQDESQATFTRKITKQDGEADWSFTAEVLARRLRAFDPWPGLYTVWNGKTLKLTKVRAVAGDTKAAGRAGAVVVTEGNGVGVLTGDGVLGLDEVQLEGRRPVPAAEFVRGQREFVGSVLPN